MEHRRIVRGAYGRYSGYEVDYEGDAFFYAFSSAEDAVAAVSDAIAGLAEGPIRIRVGIHTGTPGLDPPKYVGMDVHLAARVMSSAHGGQVVLSQATAALIEHSVTELGEHRLKDIAEPVAIFQLGKGSFPPLKTISNTNLPRPASSFVGREAELADVLGRIQDEHGERVDERQVADLAGRSLGSQEVPVLHGAPEASVHRALARHERMFAAARL